MNEKSIIIDGKENIIKTPVDPDTKVLTELYDVCNRLFKDKEKCFYTTEEVKKIRAEGSKTFI